MTDTIWVAIITACATTIPQIIIAIINKSKELKLIKIEHFEKYKLNAIANFLEVTGSIHIDDGISYKERASFDKSVNNLLLYFPEIDSKIISDIYDSLSEWNVEKRQNTIQPLIKYLAKSIKEK